MSEIDIYCPHCGTSFKVSLDGNPSSLMIFSCAKCNTPLMYSQGETAELDREEFANLRKKLGRVINMVINQNSASSEVAKHLQQMIETSNSIAEERIEKQSENIISDEQLNILKKSLDELNVDEFLSSL